MNEGKGFALGSYSYIDFYHSCHGNSYGKKKKWYFPVLLLREMHISPVSFSAWLIFDTIVALQSESSILNNSVRSLCNSFLVVVLLATTMVGSKLHPLYVLLLLGN